MSFTLLSLVFLGIALLGVFIEVRRGLRRGFVYAAVGLSTVLVSAVGAVALALLKVGRIAKGQRKADNYIDLAGYAACAAEIVEKEEKTHGI